MIKNLLNADEEPPEGTKVIVEETVITPPADNPPAEVPVPEAPETRQAFEIPGDAKFFRKAAEGEDWTIDESELEAALAEMGIDPNAEPNVESIETRAAVQEAAAPAQDDKTPGSETAEKTPLREKNESAAPPLFAQTPYQSETPTEAIRNSGLAYSAAIVLFGAVVLMMIFGWLVDLLLGTSPWGIAGGIILGGLVGFIQFFRITSSIFRK